jgi:hypothetical protein
MAKAKATKATSTSLWTVKQLGQHFSEVAHTSHKALKECWAQAHAIYVSVGADKDKQQTVKAAIVEVYTRAFTQEGEYFGMTPKALANKLRKVCGILADSKKPDAVQKAKSRGSKGKANKVKAVKKPTGSMATSKQGAKVDLGVSFRPKFWREDIEPALQYLAMTIKPCATSDIVKAKQFAVETVAYIAKVMKINNAK